MTNFLALAKNGGLDVGSEFNRARLKDFLKQNEGARLRISLDTPESKNLRGYLEGALIPMIAFYQEGHNHRDRASLAMVREWLRLEFNSDMCVVAGKAKRVATSTKGREELRKFTDRVIDWMEENGYDIPNPDEYKKWRDSIKPYTAHENFIDYLIEIGRL